MSLVVGRASMCESVAGIRWCRYAAPSNESAPRIAASVLPGRESTGRATPIAPRLGRLGFAATHAEKSGRRRRALLKVVADLPYFDSRTRIFKLLLDFCRLFLVDAFLDRLRRRLDKVLRLLEAKLRQRPHFLDHIDLLLAERGQDDIEFGLLGDRLGDRRRRQIGRA